MSSAALPANYRVDAGTQVDALDSMTGWTVTNGAGSIVNGAMLLTVTSAGGQGRVQKSLSADLTAADVVEININIPDLTNFKQITLYFAPVGDFARFFAYTIAVGAFVQGDNLLRIQRDDWANSGGAAWDEPMVSCAIRIDANAGETTAASVSNLRAGVRRLPRILIHWDDESPAAYTTGFPAMQARGFAGTMNVISGVVGDVGVMTAAQLQDMYDDGWAMCNHTDTHPHLTSLTQAQVEAELTTCHEYLLAQGWTRGAEYVAYPYGDVDATVQSAMTALGFEYGRGIGLADSVAQSPPQDALNVRAYAMDDRTSLAAAKTLVDAALRDGATLILVFHLLDVAAAAETWATTDFEALLDYLVERQAPVVTMDEWVVGMSDPRYRSVPLAR